MSDEADAPTPIEVPNDTTLMEKIVNLSKRRGFVFPSAEIYGGFRSTYDYGPIGVQLLRNVKDAWWRSMVQMRDDVVGLDAAILSPPSGKPPAISRTSPIRSSTAVPATNASARTNSTT
jgi:glycyl-tRNA synthetase